MGISGKFNGLRPPTKLISSLYGNAKETDDNGDRIDGVCSACNNWDAELVSGHCRDESCNISRQNKNVSEGRAVKYSTDIITSKGSGTVIERGSMKRFIKRK